MNSNLKMFAEYAVSCWYLTFAFLKAFFFFYNAEGKLLVCVCDRLAGETQFCDCNSFFAFQFFLSICLWFNPLERAMKRL